MGKEIMQNSQQEKSTTLEQLKEAINSPEIQAVLNDHKGAKAACLEILDLRGVVADKVRELKDNLQNLELSFKKGDFQNEEVKSLLSKKRCLIVDTEEAERDLQELDKSLLPAVKTRARKAEELAGTWIRHICNGVRKNNSAILQEKINEIEALILEHNGAIADLFGAEKIRYDYVDLVAQGLILNKASTLLRRIVRAAQMS
jgi:hypothetical protein